MPHRTLAPLAASRGLAPGATHASPGGRGSPSAPQDPWAVRGARARDRRRGATGPVGAGARACHGEDRRAEDWGAAGSPAKRNAGGAGRRRGGGCWASWPHLQDHCQHRRQPPQRVPGGRPAPLQPALEVPSPQLCVHQGCQPLVPPQGAQPPAGAGPPATPRTLLPSPSASRRPPSASRGGGGSRPGRPEMLAGEPGPARLFAMASPPGRARAPRATRTGAPPRRGGAPPGRRPPRGGPPAGALYRHRLRCGMRRSPEDSSGEALGDCERVGGRGGRGRPASGKRGRDTPLQGCLGRRYGPGTSLPPRSQPPRAPAVRPRTPCPAEQAPSLPKEHLGQRRLLGPTLRGGGPRRRGRRGGWEGGRGSVNLSIHINIHRIH